MRILFFAIVLSTVLLAPSCKNSPDKTAPDPQPVSGNQTGPAAADDSSAQYLAAALQTVLPEWKASFKNFQPDSFQFTQRSSYADKELMDTSGMKNFFELYGPSLVYSPDSSQFVDIYSSGISLERQGKKIVAISDVDMAISVGNRQTGQWKQVAFFGPSAGIEEASWVSNSIFVLAGTMQNDDGVPQAFLLVGNTEQQKLSWYESRISRSAGMEYTGSGMKKLKIDEWE